MSRTSRYFNFDIYSWHFESMKDMYYSQQNDIVLLHFETFLQ